VLIVMLAALQRYIGVSEIEPKRLGTSDTNC